MLVGGDDISDESLGPISVKYVLKELAICLALVINLEDVISILVISVVLSLCT